MPARAVGIVAALIGGVAWMGKILVMAVQGGPDPDSIPEAIAAGMVLAAVVVVGVAQAALTAPG